MAKFKDILAKGDVTITPELGKFRFRFNKYDRDTGDFDGYGNQYVLSLEELEEERQSIMERKMELLEALNEEIRELDEKISAINNL